MIRNSKQIWEIGATVKVGFLSGLRVVAKVPTPGDYAPDAYVLIRGATTYWFVPHKGLSRMDAAEAAQFQEAA